MKKKVIICLLFVAAAISLLLVASRNSVAHAANLSTFPSTGTAQSIIKKTDYHTIGTCYSLKLGGDKKYYDDIWDYDHIGRDLTKDSNVGDWYQINTEVQNNRITGTYIDTRWGYSWRWLLPVSIAKNQVYFPNGLTPAAGDSSNCAQAFYGNDYTDRYKTHETGDGWTNRIFDRIGKNSLPFEKNDTDTKIESFMTGMGYTKTVETIEDEGKKCISITYTPVLRGLEGYSGASPTLSQETTGSACFDVKDGKIKSYRPEYDVEAFGSDERGGMGKVNRFLRFDSDSNGSAEYYLHLRIRFNNTLDGEEEFNTRYSDCDDSPEYWQGLKSCFHSTPVYLDDETFEPISFYDMEWTTFMTKIKDLANRMTNTFVDGSNRKFYALGCDGYVPSSGMWWWYEKGYCARGQYKIYITSATVNEWNSGSDTVIWKLNDRSSTAVDKVISYLGGTSLSSNAVSVSEEALLYQYYIIDKAKGVVKCNLSSDAVQSNFKSVKWFDTYDERKNCYITNWNEGGTYNVLTSSKTSWTPVSFDSLVDTLNGLSLTTINDAYKDDVATVVSTLTGGNEEGDGGGGDTKVAPNCYSKSGALGWVLCPIIEQGADFVEGIYEKFIEPFLVLDSGLFDTRQSGGNATWQAWTQFQMYANLIFIAGFIFVIFSQLTGIGIDNYGIKKILPKLIVCAILINLSYIICQLAIDVANIIGYGLKSIFDGIGKIDVSTVSLAEAPSNTGAAIGATAILVVLVGLLAAPAILAEGAAILVPIFLAIIGIVIAIFSLFCILALRKAMAVVLVVISPLAFVCYMLPNTKKLYDRWFTFFKAVLLSFPICSAMVYGGHAASRIIVSAAGTSNIPSLLALSAAIMSIAPVFLIPGVIRKSMGAIATTISNLSHRAAAGARERTRKYSRGINYLQQRGRDRMEARQGEYNNRRATKAVERMDNRMKSREQTLGDLDPIKRRMYMRAQGTTAMHDNDMQKAYAMSFQKMDTSSIVKSFSNMMNNARKNPGSYDKNLASAAIQQLSDTNQHEDLNNMLSETMKEGFVSKMKAEDRRALGAQLAGLKGSNVVSGLYGKSLTKGGDDDFDDYLAGGFKTDINNAGKNIIASQDDSTLSFMAKKGARFSDDQMRNSIGNLDTKQQNAVNRMWSDMKEDDAKRILSGMSTEQYAKVDENLARAIGGGQTELDLQNGRNIINSATLSQRQALMSDDGAQIRASQTASQQAINDWTQASAEEIKRVLESVHGGNTWDKLSPEDKSTYFYNNPQEAGESNDDYMKRVMNQHAAAVAEAVKNAGYRNGPAAPTAEPTPAPTS